MPTRSSQAGRKTACGTLQDVETLDKRRQEKQAKKSGTASRQTRNTSTNRFNNFEQRSYNYDDYVWEDIKNRNKRPAGPHIDAWTVRVIVYGGISSLNGNLL